jgi:hypothetical protein
MTAFVYPTIPTRIFSCHDEQDNREPALSVLCRPQHPLPCLRHSFIRLSSPHTKCWADRWRARERRRGHWLNERCYVAADCRVGSRGSHLVDTMVHACGSSAVRLDAPLRHSGSHCPARCGDALPNHGRSWSLAKPAPSRLSIADGARQRVASMALVDVHSTRLGAAGRSARTSQRRHVSLHGCIRPSSGAT